MNRKLLKIAGNPDAQGVAGNLGEKLRFLVRGSGERAGVWSWRPVHTSAFILRQPKLDSLP